MEAATFQRIMKKHELNKLTNREFEAILNKKGQISTRISRVCLITC